MANMLLEDHPPSLREKRRMKLEIVKEFCKLGKHDMSGVCTDYSRSRWRSWIRGKK